jgi:hypothetical protein
VSGIFLLSALFLSILKAKTQMKITAALSDSQELTVKYLKNMVKMKKLTDFMTAQKLRHRKN